MFSLSEKKNPSDQSAIRKESDEQNAIRVMVQRAKSTIFGRIYINDQTVAQLSQLTQTCQKHLTNNAWYRGDDAELSIKRLYELCTLISGLLGVEGRYSNYFPAYINEIMRLNEVVYQLSRAYGTQARDLIVLVNIEKIANELLAQLEYILDKKKQGHFTKIPAYFEALNEIAKNKFIAANYSAAFDCRYHACIYNFSLLSQGLLQEYYAVTTSSTAVFFKKMAKNKGISNSEASYKYRLLEQLLAFTTAMPPQIYYCDTTAEFKQDKLAFIASMQETHEKLVQIVTKAHQRFAKASCRDFDAAYSLIL